MACWLFWSSRGGLIEKDDLLRNGNSWDKKESGNTSEVIMKESTLLKSELPDLGQDYNDQTEKTKTHKVIQRRG